MQHLVVIKLLLNKHNNKEKGFNLLEVVLVSVIVGIMAGISVPNFLEEQRQQRVNEAFNWIRGALVEAQTNASRLSTDCTVTIDADQVSGSPPGCVLEKITFDTNIIDIRSSAGSLPQDIGFQFDGRLSSSTSLQTIHIKRKNAPNETGKCIVISNNLGMIRTGIYNSTSSANCENLENRRYPE